jgi:hypothetical protein
MSAENTTAKQLTSSFYAIILDESGSMYQHTADTLGSLKQFQADQRKISAAGSQVQLTTFNHQPTLRWTGKITDELAFEYSPRGNTALHDAIHFGIQQTESALAVLHSLGHTPADIYCIIITDGEENASRTYTQTQSQELIKTKTEKENWKFVYLGANQDAFKAGSSIGVGESNCLNYAQNSKATPNAFKSVSQAIYRQKATGDVASMEFTADERMTSNTA